eukprot:8099239-Pyramimonas_sp.AAC.2
MMMSNYDDGDEHGWDDGDDAGGVNDVGTVGTKVSLLMGTSARGGPRAPWGSGVLGSGAVGPQGYRAIGLLGYRAVGISVYKASGL